MSNDNQTPKGEEQDPAPPTPAEQEKEAIPAGNKIFSIYKQMPDCPLKVFLSKWFSYYDDAPTPADEKGADGLVQDFKELNIYLDVLCTNGHDVKDAGHTWIAFTDKFNAFRKRVLAATAPQQEAAQGADNKEVEIYNKWFKSENDYSQANILNAIQDGITTAPQAAQGKEVEFAEWIRVNYSPTEDEPDLWMQCATNTKYLQTKIPDIGAYTTAELFQLFQLFKSQL